jgi:hypothetical protein
MLADSIDVRGDPLSDMSVLTGALAMKGERSLQAAAVTERGRRITRVCYDLS